MTSRLRNLYAGVLQGRGAEFFRQAADLSPEEILMSNWHLIQSMLLARLDGAGAMDRQAQIVMAALEVLVEQEQIEQDYADYVAGLLRGADLETITRITTASANLPMVAANLRRQGDLQAQVGILQDFLVLVMQVADDPGLRRAGVDVITRLKLQGGLPQESLDQLLSLIMVGASDDEDAEAVDVDAEDAENPN